MNWTRLAGAVVFLIGAAGFCAGQDQTPKPAAPVVDGKFFRLDVVLREMEAGRAVSSRAYSTIVQEGRNGANIRSGAKIPTASGTPAQYTYLDVGISFDFGEVKQIGSELMMRFGAEATTPAEEKPTLAGAPTIRTFRWNTMVILPLRKATILETSDDPSSKRQIQIELTATPLN